MPAGLAPLCPSCLDRALAWTAAKCPSCRKSSSVAACDACGKSRAGGFVPDDPKKPEAGGAVRFLCVDCMERDLETEANDHLRNLLLAVALTVAAVWFSRDVARDRVALVSVIVGGLFLAAIGCLISWQLALRNAREPARHPVPVWNLFRRRIARGQKKKSRVG
jgi:hypothetical protein